MTPDLSLSVQYGVEEPRLPRWRLRRWAERALAAAAEDGLVDFTAAELSLRLVGAAEGRRLNRDFRQRDYATNVLTFEYGVDPLGVARNLALAEALKPIAERHGTTQAAVAIAWTLAWPGVTGAIVGMRNVAQVDGVLGAAELELDGDDMARIADAIELTGAGVGPLLPVDDSGALPANLLR